MKNCHPRSIETCNDDGCVRLELRYTTMCHWRGETVSFQIVAASSLTAASARVPIALSISSTLSATSSPSPTSTGISITPPTSSTLVTRPSASPVLPTTAPALATASFRIPTTCALSRLLCLLLAPIITTPASPRRRTQMPSPPSHAPSPLRLSPLHRPLIPTTTKHIPQHRPQHRHQHVLLHPDTQRILQPVPCPFCPNDLRGNHPPSARSTMVKARK